MGTQFIGLDVHQASSTIAVMDEKGRLVRQTVMRTSEQELIANIVSIQGRKVLTFEEGSMSDWLYSLLNSLVDRLVVCNPRAISKSHRDPKNDALDAQTLADLLRGGYLKPVFHNTTTMDVLRSRLRTYKQINRDTTRCKNRLKALVGSRGIKTDATLYNPRARQEHLARLDQEQARERALYLFEQLDLLTDQKKRAERALLAKAKVHKAYKQLRSVPGIGPINAAKLLAVVVTPFRFRTKRQFWKYSGLAVLFNTSSDWEDGPNGLEQRRKKKTLGLNPDRNPVMKEVFKTAATVAIQKGPFQQYYERQVERGLKPSVARVTVARKLATIVLTLWKKGVTFDPKFVA